MPSRARTMPDAPPTFPPFPGWARQAMTSESIDDAMFCAGVALLAIHQIAGATHPLATLWRRRLALRCAASVVQQNGRTEDEAALRDQWFLTPPGADPGPAGRLLQAWRWLGDPGAMRSAEWAERLPALLDLAPAAEITDTILMAVEQAQEEGSPIDAAARVLRRCQELPRIARILGLWLADAVVAHRLHWPTPVPLLAACLNRADLRATDQNPDGGWRIACAQGYARAGAGAFDLYGDLARRADKLLAVAPALRGKDADRTVARVMVEDALAAKTGEAASDRSSRRLFERLVALGGVRELTGRPTFRLYGL